MAKKQKQANASAGPTAAALRPPLSGKLDEFRTALEEEIKAAATAANGAAIPLVNGRSIGNAAGGFQYAFLVANVLNFPADMPGNLVVGDQPPRPVTIISIVGLTVTLHVAENLGAFVPTARLQTDLTFLLRRLIERVESLANNCNHVADRLIDGLPVGGKSATVCIPALNDEQAQAVASSLGRDTTFIWGPPGTGKTRTIGAIGEQLYRHGRSVLLVSHTNTAVDQALLHIGRSLAQEDLESGKVLRMGTPRDRRLADWPDLLLASHVERRSQALVARQAQLQADRVATDEERSRAIRLINIHGWLSTTASRIGEFEQSQGRLKQLEERFTDLCAEQQRLSADRANWEAIKSQAADAAQLEDDLKRCRRTLGDLNQKHKSACSALENARKRLANAEREHAYASSLKWVTRKWRGIAEPSQLLEVVQRCAPDVTQGLAAVQAIEQQLAVTNVTDQDGRQRLLLFQREFGGTPAEMAAQADEHFEKLRQVDDAITEVLNERSGVHKNFTDGTVQAMHEAQQLALSNTCPRSPNEALAEIKNACMRAKVLTTRTDRKTLAAGLETLDRQLLAISEELTAIAEQLATVEAALINDASVIATTLTGSYLRNSLHARRFDTVILDEASMAPLPALWVAATLADHNAVVVGDFRQLPPIVQSSHEMAKKWLGRDIFEVARVNDTGRQIPHRIDLLLQYRMHPAVSRIPNLFFYSNALRDATETTDANADLCLGDWYDKNWGRQGRTEKSYDRPLLLVDMEPMNAWVTSVGRAGQPSRMNFLSAVVCVDIAEKMLRNNREPVEPGQSPRILIVCPYRPHARLLEVLIREQGLSGDVAAGTAHSFQGAEANVVILDLVNDEPHWRVRMFDPNADDDTQRLLNVSLTRAQRRLVVVGDFSYIEKTGKNAFLGRMLSPLLRRWSTPVSAKEIVSEGPAQRAAKAQATIAGGTLEATDERVVVTQDNFDRLLIADLQNAKCRVVIYSPFLTSNRLQQIGLQFQAAVEKGIRVYVITKAIDDRGQREKNEYRRLERLLRERGIAVIHKQRMHEKLIFVDDEMRWRRFDGHS
jgi:hypothetical protein